MDASSQGYNAGYYHTDASLDSAAWGAGLKNSIAAFERGYVSGENKRRAEEIYADDHPVVAEWIPSRGGEEAVYCSQCHSHMAACECRTAVIDDGRVYSCCEQCERDWERDHALRAARSALSR
jgi:hypothetical protein